MVDAGPVPTMPEGEGHRRIVLRLGDGIYGSPSFQSKAILDPELISATVVGMVVWNSLDIGEEKAKHGRVTKRLKFDRIGNWSEIKLEILRKYASAYSTILAKQKGFHHVYIEGFAGAGIHVLKSTEEFVPGSPLNALRVDPPFKEYHFVDIDPEKISVLRTLIGSADNVYLYPGDCNKILLDQVFPKVDFEKYRRGLCILDPYGLDLDWTVVIAAGQSNAIDLFLNFPVADINRNVLWRDPEGVDPSDISRMDAFWGDNSWRDIAYQTTGNLFGFPEKKPNEVVEEAFRQRLIQVAGFKSVPEPLPMRNSKGAIIYYLFFASQKDVAEGIVLDIFSKYRKQGEA